MKRQLWGILFLTLGVLVLLQVAFGIGLGLSFWPVVMLFGGASILFWAIGSGFGSWFIFGIGLWVSSIGLFGILANAGASTISGGDIARFGWPILLIAIGLSIMIGDHFWFARRARCGSTDEKEWANCSQMRHIGDLYHGRAPWVLDRNHDFYHGIGDVVIDLTTADIKPGRHRIFVKAGIGEVTVRVPGDICIEAEASVGIGELELLGEKRSGFTGFSMSRNIEAPGSEATIEIEARLGIGDLTVIYQPAIPGS